MVDFRDVMVVVMRDKRAVLALKDTSNGVLSFFFPGSYFGLRRNWA